MGVSAQNGAPVGVSALLLILLPPPAKEALKNLCRKSNSNVSGLRAEVSWRNKSFSRQSQREISGCGIGMHSGHFWVPRGSFLIFWTGLASKILWREKKKVGAIVRTLGKKKKKGRKRKSLKIGET